MISLTMMKISEEIEVIGDPLMKITHSGLPNIEAQVTFRMQITGTFQRKKRSKIDVNEDQTEVINVTKNNSGISWRPFHGTRRVRNYNLTSIFSEPGYKHAEISHPGSTYKPLKTLTITCN